MKNEYNYIRDVTGCIIEKHKSIDTWWTKNGNCPWYGWFQGMRMRLILFLLVDNKKWLMMTIV